MQPDAGRVYRMAPVQVTIHDLLGLCFFAIATLTHLRPDGQRWLLWLASAVLWLPGLAFHWYARRVQLVWLSDRLRYRNLFRTHSLDVCLNSTLPRADV